METKYGIDMEAGAAEASVEHNEQGKISLFLFCHEYCQDYRKQMSIRKFLDELGITEKDCIEAFKEVSDDTV